MEQPIVNAEPVIEAPTTEPVVTETVPKPGEKTDPAKLLESLQEERKARREAEDTARRLEQELATRPEAPSEFSEEGQALKKEIDSVKADLARREEQLALKALESQFPALGDKSQEFEAYRLDNPGMKLETAAKAFLVENELLTTPTRKGLEKPSGGGRQPVNTGTMTPEEVDTLRVTNYRKYSDMVRKGQIKL